MIVGSAWLVILLMAALGCDDFSHDAIVNTPPANYVTLLMSKTVGGDSADTWRDVTPGPNDGLLMLGSTHSWGHGESAFYYVSVDGSRAVAWSKFPGGWGRDHGEGLLRTGSGNVLLVGGTSSYDLVTQGKPTPNNNPDFDFQNQNILVLLTDADGEVVWERAIGDPVTEEWATSAVADGDGYLVAGVSGSAESMSELVLVRLNSTGEVDWQKSYSSSALAREASIVATADNAFVLAGYGLYGPTRLRDPNLVKVDGAGTVVWEKTFGYANSQDRIFGALPLADGLICCGSASRYTGTDSATELLYLLKTDLNGNAVWENTYDQTNINEGRSVVAKTDGTFLVCGQNSSTGAIDIAHFGAGGTLLWSDGAGVTGESMEMITITRGFAVIGSGLQEGSHILTDGLILEFVEDLTNLE
jgi:hypothetical protein